MILRKISSVILFMAVSTTALASTVNVYNMTSEAIRVSINNGLYVSISEMGKAPINFDANTTVAQGNLGSGDNSVSIYPIAQGPSGSKNILLKIPLDLSDSIETLHMVIIKNGNNEYTIPPLY